MHRAAFLYLGGQTSSDEFFQEISEHKIETQYAEGRMPAIVSSRVPARGPPASRRVGAEDREPQRKLNATKFLPLESRPFPLRCHCDATAF